VAPLPGRSEDSLDQALDSLLKFFHNQNIKLTPAAQQGWESTFRAIPKKPLPLAALLSGHYKEVLAQAYQAKQEGFSAAKIKCALLSPKEVGLVVQKMQGALSLRLDYNLQGMGLDQPLLGIDFIEEGLGHCPGDPFALDESLPWSSPKALHAAKALIIKPTVLGGILGLQERGLYQYMTKMIWSSSLESGLGLLHVGSLALALQKGIQPLGLDTYKYFQADILRDPLQIINGSLMPLQEVRLNHKRLHLYAHGICTLPFSDVMSRSWEQNGANL
jgi:O-succinylbenzoate synthase